MTFLKTAAKFVVYDDENPLLEIIEQIAEERDLDLTLDGFATLVSNKEQIETRLSIAMIVLSDGSKAEQENELKALKSMLKNRKILKNAKMLKNEN